MKISFPRLPLALALLASLSMAVNGQARAQEPEPFTVTLAEGGVNAIPGEEVTFTVTAPLPGRNYVWSFGDGSRPITGTLVRYRYDRVDDFTVKLGVQFGGTQTWIGERTLRVMPELKGVFASDIDGQFTPADLFQMAVVVRAPGLRRVGLRTAGSLVLPREAQKEVTGGDDFLVLDDMRLVDERDPIVRDEILAKPKATVPFTGGAFTLALDYTTSAGRPVTVSFTPPIKDFFDPDKLLSMSYPRMLDLTGIPDSGLGENFYYLKGNPDFSHTEDFYVRLLALEFGRRGGPWPDAPEQVAMNLFTSIDTLFGDADPGEFNNDYNIARMFENGMLSRTRKNGDYICIAQAYLFTGLARTLGFPAREYNNAIGEAQSQNADGSWKVRWWQEAGAELWYDGGWHYFDTYLAVTDRRQYLQKNLIYQAWHSYNEQNIEFLTVRGERTGLRGHDFSAWPGDPPQWAFVEEGVRPGVRVEGMIGAPPAAAVTGGAPAISLYSRGVAAFPPLGVAQPPAAGIATLPATADP